MYGHLCKSNQNKGKETSGKDRIIQTASKIKAKNKSQNGIIEAKGKKAHTQSTHATLRQKME